jgi:hypothetical protein
MKFTATVAISLLFVLISPSILAQKGKIRGTIIDDASGEPLFGATVLVKGTSIGSATDFEGKFEVQLEPGTYDLQASFVTYKTINITGLTVTSGEVTVIDQVRLQEDVAELQEVVITAEAIKTTENALLTVKKKSANVLDGISSESFKRIGATDAASAVTKVPGVSVQGGKYVFVRGLGDRYTKTTVSNVDVPGLDPDRNSIQLDIFPTNIINNIVVVKSFTADLPADFTGGIVNIDPKDFPDTKTISVSANIGYNPQMNFNNNYLSYDGGKTDFLGVDDGSRSIPISSRASIPSPIGNQPELTRIVQSFNPIFGPTERISSPNYSLSFAMGNQVDAGSVKIGYNTNISYQNTTTFFEDVQVANVFEKNNDPSVFEMDTARTQTGSDGSNNVLLSGLFGVAVKTNRSKFSLTGLRIQNGESSSSIYERVNSLNNRNESIRYGINYAERSVTNGLLSGEHHVGEGWAIDWKLSSTFSILNDLDNRVIPFTVDEDGNLSLEPSEGGEGLRLWRFLDEVNNVGKLDFVKDFNYKGRKAKAKFGTALTLKSRDFSTDNFDFLIQNQDELNINGDPNNLLLSENVYNNGTGTFVRASFQGSNTYESSSSTKAVYVSGELPFTSKLRAILGIRMEQFVQNYTGGDQEYFSSDSLTGRFLDNEEVLNSTKFFPTANLVYSLTDVSNLRVSYSKTIARPSFKEKSVAQIVDLISGTTYIGNIDLIETDINNFDLRWETFYQKGQTIALSAFYKQFHNPIEIQVFSPDVPTNYTARNNGDASVLGVELEWRKNLDFVTPILKDLSFNVNASVIESRLEVGEEELEDRRNNLREGETVENNRVMQGQSPYLVNLGLNYDNAVSKWEAGVFYNVQGPALSIVGVGNIPDTYSNPFHSLNASAKKSFGATGNSSIQIRVSNLLNDKIESEFRSHNAADRIQSIRSPGRTFTISFGYSF